MSKILVQCVVVLYRCALTDSKTLRSLAEICHQHGDFSRKISLLIYDNSQDLQIVSEIDRWNLGAVDYYQASANGGLAPAYNRALSAAIDSGIDWLLLLDQDTDLSAEFLLTLFAAVENPSSDVCAIVPKLAQGQKVLSPQIEGRFHNYDLRASFSGVYQGKVAALNSGACLRVSAVSAIGGFPSEYRLEFLDHIMFHRLQTADGRVLILDVSLQHSLSIHNLEKEMSLSRYKSVLSAEWRFIRETHVGGGPIVHRFRLIKRTFTHAIRVRDKAYAIETLRAILG